MLTVIAAALIAIAVRGFDVVGSAIAGGDKVHKIAICDHRGRACADLWENRALEIYNYEG